MKGQLRMTLIGAVLMIIGIVGARMKVETTWHYFGNGVVFGFGLAVVLSRFFIKPKNGAA